MKRKREQARERAIKAAKARKKEEEFAQMQEDYERRVKALGEELNQVEDDKAGVQAKLDKAKEDLKKAKQKLKDSEAGRDEEVQKRVEEFSVELTNKAKEDAFAESEAELKKNAEEIRTLEAQIEKLEADKAKLSNTSLREFKVYVDQLQDIYFKICDIITEESLNDEETGAKMKAALQKIIGDWRP